MDGWMNTDTSLYKPFFHKRPGSKAAFGIGTRSRGGSFLLFQYPEHSTTPYFCLVNTEALHAEPLQEGMRTPPSSPSAVC